MRWIAAAAATLILLGASCTRASVRVAPSSTFPMDAHRESVILITSDGVRLVGHWYSVAHPVGWALLLHMMPATKESYTALAAELQRGGVASLAIDFRGHGESQGGPTGYERFSDAEQQAKIHDVEAAVEWLRAHGATDAHLVLVGASIGANLALQFLADHADVSGVVLLSPGLNYRGMVTEPLAQRVSTAQRVFLAAGGADDEYSTTSVNRLTKIFGTKTTTHILTGAGHGTTMFERDPTLLTEVAGWVYDRVSTP